MELYIIRLLATQKVLTPTHCSGNGFSADGSQPKAEAGGMGCFCNFGSSVLLESYPLYDTWYGPWEKNIGPSSQHAWVLVYFGGSIGLTWIHLVCSERHFPTAQGSSEHSNGGSEEGSDKGQVEVMDQ